MEVFVEQIDLILLLRQWAQVLRLAFHILNVPLTLEVLPLFVGSSEHSRLPANCALHLLLFHLLLALLYLWLFGLSLDLFLVLLTLLGIEQFEGTELFGLKPFVFFVDDDPD